MELLIVKLAALGDVLRTTSVLRRLKDARPAARATWLTARAALPLLAGNPDVERALAIEDAPPLGRRFELVLSLEEDAAAARAAEAACSGELIGVYERSGLRYTASSALYYDLSALNRDPDGSLAGANRLKVENRLSYARLWLRILGLPEPRDPAALRPVLALQDSERKAAGRRLRLGGAEAPSRAIGFNPGAGARWPSKQLSASAAARLADALAELGRPVLLLGGPDERERNREILALARRPIVDAGVHPLREFAGLLSRLAALVTVDSLALHVATALGVPAVALVGPTSAAELDVFGRGAVLAAPSCSCFYRSSCRLEESCLDRLEPARIAAALAPWLTD